MRQPLKDFLPLPEVSQQYSPEFMVSHQVLKLSESEEEVLVGGDEFSDDLKELLEKFHRKKIRFQNLLKEDLTTFLGKLYSNSTELNITENEKGLQLDEIALDAPVINLLNTIILEAQKRKSSDIHIESKGGLHRVRIRVDGILRTLQVLQQNQVKPLVARIKYLSELNTMETRIPQDGRFTVRLGSSVQDVRVSLLPEAEGTESVALRLLSPSGMMLGLNDLGLSVTVRQALEPMFQATSGLILATGPTGSGKSTTLHAIIKEINNEKIKVVSLEDPVEYIQPETVQIQIHEKIGLGFETLLRRILRHDPDVIMVGEIRDTETAELAIRAGMTGHLVLSTLHTRDAASAVRRLIDMHVDGFLVADVINAVIAQRLVRQLCRHCRKQTPLDDHGRRLLKHWGIQPLKTYTGLGCEHCDHSGYVGRIGIFEVLLIDGEMRDMIASGVTSEVLRTTALQKGQLNFFRDAEEKLSHGMTSMEEVVRVLGGI